MDPEPGKAVTQTSSVLVKQVVFLTVNHRGPLPLRAVIRSTGETIVWRDPRGSWACLPPVYDYESEITLSQADTCRLHPENHCEKNRAKRTGWAKKKTEKKTLSWAEEGVTQDWKNRHSDAEQMKEPY